MRRAIRALRQLRRQLESMGDATLLCGCDDEVGVICWWCAPATPSR
jgi:hypothetical protein